MTLKGLMLRFRTVLFDLDGTLVDAFTTIHRAYCHTLPLFGVPAPSAEEVRRSVGGGLEHAMSLFLPPHLVAEACRVHVAYTEKILLEDPVLCDGAMELVGVLHAQGVKTGVLTNKIGDHRSEEHTSELQSPCNLVCRLLLEKKKR